MLGNILVVDDDHGIIEALTLILEDAGYVVRSTMKVEAINGNIKAFKPDVILLDVLLSGHDGRDICSKLKSDPTTKNISIIMISAHPTAKEGALNSGADDFLAKPFELDDLLRVIAKQRS